MLAERPKLAIGFVIYRPEPSFYDRLKLIEESALPFYVFDNSPEIAESRSKIEPLLRGNYFSSGSNAGLGVALSRLCQSANKDGFDALLFFDQDTGYNLKTISFIRSFTAKNFSHLLDQYSAIVFSGEVTNTPPDDNESIIDVDFAINSGSVFILRNLEKLNWHNESYFVDGVDYEFCLRSHITGFRVGKCLNTPNFDHETEQPDRIISLFGKKLLIRKYSPTRIKDAVYSYFKLIHLAISSSEWRFAMKIIRSLLIYVLGQFLSRLTWKN